MFKKLQRKRRERRELGERVRKIHDRAKDQRRSLTAQERDEVDEALERAETLRDEIERLERTQELEEDLSATEGRAIAGDGIPGYATAEELRALEGRRGIQSHTTGTGRPGGAEAEIAFRATDEHGREIRALTPRARLADHAEYDLPDGIRPEELHVGRLIRATITGDWRGAEAEQRVLLGAQDVSAGYLVPEVMSDQVIDLARAQAVVLRAGAATVQMTSDSLKFAKLTGSSTAEWKAEAKEITESTPTVGAITLYSHTLATLTSMSIELVEDSPNAEDVLSQALAQDLALKLDDAAMFGTGENQPVGLAEDDDVQELDLGTNGATLDGYQDFSDAVQLVKQQNGIPSAVVMAPRTEGDLDRMLDGDGQPIRPLPSWGTLRKFTSTQIPTDQSKGTATDASTAFLGDFSKVLWGVRSGIRIEASREADDAFKRGIVYIRGLFRGDVGFSIPEHLVRIVGILPE